MSDIIHQVSNFRFINRTRYDSEDIKTLIAYLAAQVSEMAGRDVKVGRPETTYEIGDFNPVTVWVTRNVWNMDGRNYTQTTGAEYVSRPGMSPRNNWKIGIVVPERLYQTKIEVLTNANEPAPEILSHQLMATVWSMPAHYSDNGTELDWGVRRKIQDRVGRGFGTECNGVRIRINAKRESAAASKGRKQRNDMAALAAKVRDIRDRTKHLAGLMENFEKDLRATIDVANKVGVAVPDPSGQLASTRRAVEGLQDTWTAIIKQNREGVV